MADEFIARHLRYFLGALGCIVFMALMCKVGLIWTQITGTKNDLKKTVPHKLLHFIIPGSQANYLVLKVPQKFLPLPVLCVLSICLRQQHIWLFCFTEMKVVFILSSKKVNKCYSQNAEPSFACDESERWDWIWGWIISISSEFLWLFCSSWKLDVMANVSSLFLGVMELREIGWLLHF